MKYKYQGYDRSARLVSGVVEASSEEEVRTKMRDQFLSPRMIAPLATHITVAEALNIPSKPALKNFTVFIRQWATMQGAGLTLLQSLSVLAEQSPDQDFAKTLNQIVKNIQEGQTLTQSLQRHPGVFDKVFINLIGAGESSGTLDRILERLATYYEKMASIRRKIVTATLYPTAIICIVAAIITGLMVFVVPIFERMFAEQGKELPYATQILLMVSRTMREQFVFIGLGVFFTIFLIVYFFKNEEAREKIDPILLYVPIFGNLLRKSCLARFCRTLGTLIQAGVPILDAFNLAAKVAGNYEIQIAAMRVQAAVKEGSSIAAPLANEASFPRMVVSMIAVGEQTGELEKMLMKVSEFYEDEVDTIVGALTSILEPLLIVVIGAVVVAVLIPLYLPIFKLGELIGN